VKVLHSAVFDPALVVLDYNLCVRLKNRQYTYTYTLCFCPIEALNSVVRMRLGISSGYEHRVHHCHHQWDTARRLTNVTVAADRSSIYGAQSSMIPIGMRYPCTTFFFYIQIWIMHGHGKGYGMVIGGTL
jgi:hypothetical protein